MFVPNDPEVASCGGGAAGAEGAGGAALGFAAIGFAITAFAMLAEEIAIPIRFFSFLIALVMRCTRPQRIRDDRIGRNPRRAGTADMRKTL